MWWLPTISDDDWLQWVMDVTKAWFVCYIVESHYIIVHVSHMAKFEFRSDYELMKETYSSALFLYHDNFATSWTRYMAANTMVIACTLNTYSSWIEKLVKWIWIYHKFEACMWGLITCFVLSKLFISHHVRFDNTFSVQLDVIGTLRGITWTP